MIRLSWIELRALRSDVRYAHAAFYAKTPVDAPGDEAEGSDGGLKFQGYNLLDRWP